MKDHLLGVLLIVEESLIIVIASVLVGEVTFHLAFSALRGFSVSLVVGF